MATIPAMDKGSEKIAINKSSIIGSGVVRLASLPPDPYILSAYVPSVNIKVKEKHIFLSPCSSAL